MVKTSTASLRDDALRLPTSLIIEFAVFSRALNSGFLVEKCATRVVHSQWLTNGVPFLKHHE